MTIKRKTGQVPAGAIDTAEKTSAVKKKPRTILTWREERFVRAYCQNKGNQSNAAIAAGYSLTSAGVTGCKLIKKAHVQVAIQIERARVQGDCGFDLLLAVRILYAQATTGLADFVQVRANPMKVESYKNLGDKEFALESVKESWTEHGRTTEIKTVSAADRRAAINDLIQLLGLNKGSGEDDRGSRVAELLESVGKLLGR